MSGFLHTINKHWYFWDYLSTFCPELRDMPLAERKEVEKQASRLMIRKSFRLGKLPVLLGNIGLIGLGLLFIFYLINFGPVAQFAIQQAEYIHTLEVSRHALATAIIPRPVPKPNDSRLNPNLQVAQMYLRYSRQVGWVVGILGIFGYVLLCRSGLINDAYVSAPYVRQVLQSRQANKSNNT